MRITGFVCVIVASVLLNCSTAAYQHLETSAGKPVGSIPTVTISGTLGQEGVDGGISDAQLIISNTSYATTSNDSGHFSFGGVALGMYRLIIDVPGFQPVIKRLRVSENMGSNLILSLTEEELRKKQGASHFDEMKKIEVAIQEKLQEVGSLRNMLAAKINEIVDAIEEKYQEVESLRNVLNEVREASGETATQDRKEIDLFQRIIIGHPLTCKLINPESLEFTTRETSKGFKIEYRASEPLIIENRELGYYLYAYLEKATLVKYHRYFNIDFDVVPFFSELSPATLEEAIRWHGKRKRVYEGSFRHLLTALANRSLGEAGFALLSQRGSVVSGVKKNMPGYMEAPSPWIALQDPYSIVAPTGREGEQMLDFQGPLQVVYFNDVPSEKRGAHWGLKGDYQISFIVLPAGPVCFNTFGHQLDYKTVSKMGFWSKTQLWELMPAGYTPDRVEQQRSGYFYSVR